MEISNSGPKSYETATVMKMPASFAEFSDALQKARIKDGSFCKNELTCIHYNGLTHAMIGWNANLYDLNLFAQRLASLTEEQKKGMDALLKIKQNHRVAPIPLNQLIMMRSGRPRTTSSGPSPRLQHQGLLSGNSGITLRTL